MARKHFTTEQIINMLREAQVHLSQSTPVAQVCKKFGISEQNYYRWRKEYGGVRSKYYSMPANRDQGALKNAFDADAAGEAPTPADVLLFNKDEFLVLWQHPLLFYLVDLLILQPVF